MDNVTHTLFGVALSRAGLNRVTPNATLLLILASNFPDLDILSFSGGQLAYLEVHRGYTHTFLALPVLAFICVGITTLLGRARIPVAKAWSVASLGVAGHLLLDWTNSYGVRPLLPFSSRWFYLDLNGLYDSVILASLLLVLVVPWFVTLVAGEIGVRHKYRGQGTAVAMLLFICLFEATRWTVHARVVQMLSDRLYDGEVPVEVSALPTAHNFLRWTGVVETQDAYRLVPANVLAVSDASDARVFSKPEPSPEYRAALATEPFRYMTYFARFPVWGIEPMQLNSARGKRPAEAKSVDLTDLRFGVPGGGSFHATAVIDATGKILNDRFTFDRGAPLDVQ